MVQTCAENCAFFEYLHFETSENKFYLFSLGYSNITVGQLTY